MTNAYKTEYLCNHHISTLNEMVTKGKQTFKAHTKTSNELKKRHEEIFTPPYWPMLIKPDIYAPITHPSSTKCPEKKKKSFNTTTGHRKD